MRTPSFIILAAAILLAAGCAAFPFQPPQDPQALANTFAALYDAVDELTEQVTAAGQRVTGRGSEAPVVASALQSLCDAMPYTLYCALSDADGIVQVVAPTDENAYIGATARAPQPPTGDSNLTCSQVYRAPEGYDVQDIGINLADGGRVAATVQLGEWLAVQIEPAIAGLSAEIWLMQPDGLILYDYNREEIGRNLFADPIYQPYPELQALGRQIAAEPSGSGKYTFLRQDMQAPIEKLADWSTIDFCGQPWRVVMAHTGQVRDDGSALAPAPDLAAAEAALRTSAADPALIDVLAAGDETQIAAALADLYTAYPNIYSIQFYDKDGVNRFGYPPEHSLLGYDFRSLQTPGDDLFLEALQRGQETSFDLRLVEGPLGHFFLAPVFDGEELLGMIYLIQTDRQTP